MDSIDDLIAEAQGALRVFSFLHYYEELDRTAHAIKFRLIIEPDLFVHVYYNSVTSRANFAVIDHHQRIYGRDSIGGQWHRHPFEDPTSHDTSREGRRLLKLTEFLVETEAILIKAGII